MNCLRTRSVIVQSVRYGHWFSVHRKKASKHLKPKIPKYIYDWEHERWQGRPLQNHPTILEQSDLFQKASDDVKRMYSYDFMTRKRQSEDEMKELFEKVGINAFEPKHRDLATHIVKLTFAIRDLKGLLEKCHRDGKMRAACATYISRRKGLLHQLRQENNERFEKVCSALNIEYQLPNPFDFTPSKDAVRKAQVRNECYELRRKKMEKFAEKLAQERQSFFAEKNQTLSELDASLKKFNLDINQLFSEVVKERQEELMGPVRHDEEYWFENEKMLKEAYARLRIEKEERLLKKKRK